MVIEVRLTFSLFGQVAIDVLIGEEEGDTVESCSGGLLGTQFGGEKIFLVDETGAILDNETASALMVELALYANPSRSVAVPIAMSNAFDQIIAWHDGGLIRIRRHLHSLMQAAGNAGILLVTDGAGNFIFPDFQPAVDGMMAAVRLLEYLVVRQLPVSEVVAYLPTIHMAKESVDCPWAKKGKVMRRLSESHQGDHVEKIDGIKIHLEDDEWVHIAPNPDKACFELSAEAEDVGRAQALIGEYESLIRDYVEHEA